MKKRMTFFIIFVLLFLSYGAIGEAPVDWVIFTLTPKDIPTAEPKWEILTIRPQDIPTKFPIWELITVRPQDVPKVTPKPAQKPKSDSGQYMTSEGPLFLSFRSDLADELYMFTPMDLSLDGEYRFPLVGSSQQVVGDAKVAVQNGMAIVTYLLVNGVSVDEEDEFFTFFPDIRSVPSVYPSKLQSVRLRFGIPYSVANWLNSDSKVLLYINCQVSYKTSLKGLTPFSFDAAGYIERIMELIPIMD